jgi:hypothetical protein
VLLVALGTGCGGEIGGRGDVPAAPGSSAGAAGTGGAAQQAAADAAAEAVRAADAAMRAQNADLFEAAMAYFPGQLASGGRQRLARLTRAQLDSTTKTLLPTSYTQSTLDALPRDPLQTNYEYAQNLSFNAANFTPYTSWVRALADDAGADPSKVVACAQADTACLQRESTSFVTRAFRGVVSEEQLTRFVQFYASSVGEVGLQQATADLVDLTLTSPGYVFRDEVLTDATGVLLAAQRLQHLTYTLADAPPESLGLPFEMAETQLGSAQSLEQTVDRILSTPEARDKLLRFFVAWLEVKEPDEFTIDSGVFPEFTPAVAAAVVEQTQAFLRHQLMAAAPRLQDITQSTEAFVSEAEAFLYGLDRAGAAQPVALDPAQRLGIFTQPAVIASHSGPTNTRLVKRGVFFTRKVMCLPLGVPPEDVDTTVPDTPNATERQRIESVTAAPRCQGCHAFINPFGFMQENYDAIGRWRTTDEGLPIDPSISVDFLDEGPLRTSSPVEAFRGLTGSLRFQQCFTRQLFRFYMGRDEEPGDDPLLRQMFFGFANGDEQQIVRMLRLLASSAGFSQRTEAP